MAKETHKEFETVEQEKTALYCDFEGRHEHCDGMVGYEEDGAELHEVVRGVTATHRTKSFYSELLGRISGPGTVTVTGEVTELCDTCATRFFPDEVTKSETLLREDLWVESNRRYVTGNVKAGAALTIAGFGCFIVALLMDMAGAESAVGGFLFFSVVTMFVSSLVLGLTWKDHL